MVKRLRKAFKCLVISGASILKSPDFKNMEVPKFTFHETLKTLD